MATAKCCHYIVHWRSEQARYECTDESKRSSRRPTPGGRSAGQEKRWLGAPSDSPPARFQRLLRSDLLNSHVAEPPVDGRGSYAGFMMAWSRSPYFFIMHS